jgi:hypothetical protein
MDRLLLHFGFDALVGILVGVFAFALWKGDVAERAGGGMNLAAGLFAMFLQPLLQRSAQPTALLLVDGALAAGFLFLALRYASLWLGGALLLQAVQFSLHAYYIVGASRPDFNHSLGFKVVNNLDTTGINICIFLGTIMAWRRRARAAKAGPAVSSSAPRASLS